MDHHPNSRAIDVFRRFWGVPIDTLLCSFGCHWYMLQQRWHSISAGKCHLADDVFDLSRSQAKGLLTAGAFETGSKLPGWSCWNG